MRALAGPVAQAALDGSNRLATVFPSDPVRYAPGQPRAPAAVRGVRDPRAKRRLHAKWFALDTIARASQRAPDGRRNSERPGRLPRRGVGVDGTELDGLLASSDDVPRETMLVTACVPSASVRGACTQGPRPSRLVLRREGLRCVAPPPSVRHPSPYQADADRGQRDSRPRGLQRVAGPPDSSQGGREYPGNRRKLSRKRSLHRESGC